MDGYNEKESGKFTRLREISIIIHEKREQVLIFTQFKEMTEPLAHFLETIWRMSSGKILLWDRINIDVS